MGVGTVFQRPVSSERSGACERGAQAMTPKEALRRYRSDLRRSLSRDGRALVAMRRLNGHRAATFNAADDRVMVWSDLHLGHDNIIRYASRPFSSAQEMNRTLWANWQRHVGPDQVLVCLGDVALSRGVSDATWNRIRTLPDRKVLVIGNHDLGKSGRLLPHGFDCVNALLTSPSDPPLIFTHAPLPNVPAGHVNIHGHQHAAMPSVGTPHINVSVEPIEYRPIRLDRLRRLARRLAAGALLGGDTTLERVRAVEP